MPIDVKDKLKTEAKKKGLTGHAAKAYVHGKLDKLDKADAAKKARMKPKDGKK